MEVTQLVLILDLEGKLTDTEVLPQIPRAEYGRTVVRLSAYRPPPVVREGSERTPVDWEGIARSAAEMVRDVQAKSRSTNLEYFIVGQAPLPVFMLVGFALSAWARPITLMNRRKDHGWDVVPLTSRGSGPPFFDTVVPDLATEPSDASGTVAVFVSSSFSPNRQHLRDFVRQRGDDLAGIVEIRTREPKLLDGVSGLSAAQELVDAFSGVARKFPHRNGVAVFVAGPATLAFLVGRAINPKVIGETAVANFAAAEGYEYCFSLPFEGQAVLNLDRGTEAVAGRQAAFEHFAAGVGELKTLEEEDVCPTVPAGGREAIIVALRKLALAPPGTGEFALSMLRNEMTVGEGLVQALRSLEASDVDRVSQLMTLHEIYHSERGIRSTNFHEVGRAGVALEQADYYADAVSVETLARWAFRRSSTVSLREHVTNYLQSTLRGMQAFDLMAGPRLERLADRRLRRYLVWHLQLRRASTIFKSSDLEELFANRVIVELAPLRGFLDRRFDKVVLTAQPSTELVVSIGPHIIREPMRAGFDPSALVEAVRRFDFNVIQSAMEFVITEHETLLVPWARR